MKLVTIQESFEDVIENATNIESENSRETFWVAERDMESMDGEQELYEVNPDITLEGNNNIQLLKIARKEYQLNIFERKYNLKSVEKCLKLVNENITALAISNNNILGIGTSAGRILIYNLKNEQLLNTITNPHMAGVTKLRIFPSDEVIISVSEDLTIRIWSLKSSQCVREFKNHFKEITDIKLIGLAGRNFLTSSRDGALNLYECGSGKVIFKFQRIQNQQDAVNCIALGALDSKVKTSELEFETEGKCVYAGYESGIIQQYDLAGHKSTNSSFCHPLSASVTSLDIISHFLVSGYLDGSLKIWDISANSLMFGSSFNPNYPIDLIKVVGYNEGLQEIKFIIYNGPETLLELNVSLKLRNISKVIHYVGLPELSQITTIDKNNESIIVGGKYGLLAIYNI